MPAARFALRAEELGVPISRARKLLPGTIHGRFSRAWVGAVVILGVFVAGVGVPDGLVTPASAAVEAPQQERSVEARPVAVPTPRVKGEEASHPAKKPCGAGVAEERVGAGERGGGQGRGRTGVAGDGGRAGRESERHAAAGRVALE